MFPPDPAVAAAVAREWLAETRASCSINIFSLNSALASIAVDSRRVWV